MPKITFSEIGRRPTTRTEKEITSIGAAGWEIELVLIEGSEEGFPVPARVVPRTEANPFYVEERAQRASTYEAKEQARKDLRLTDSAIDQAYRRLRPKRTDANRSRFKEITKSYGTLVELGRVATRLPNPIAVGRPFGDLTRLNTVWRQMAIEIAESNPQVIQAQDLDGLVPAVWAANLAQPATPVVFDSHEWFTELNYLPEIYRRAWVEIAKTFIPEVDLAFGVSPQMANWLSGFGARRVEVLWNFPSVDLARSTQELKRGLNLDSSVPLAIHIGMMAHDRGADKAIELLDRLPSLHFCFVGAKPGPKPEELSAIAASRGFGHRLHYIEWIDPLDLVAVISDANVNVVLHDDGHFDRRRTMPNKLFDGLAAGLPTVGHNNTFVGHYLQEHSVGLTYSSDHELPIVVEKALGDTDLRERVIAARGRFAWDTQAADYVGYLGEIVDRADLALA